MPGLILINLNSRATIVVSETLSDDSKVNNNDYLNKKLKTKSNTTIIISLSELSLRVIRSVTRA
jgi:hypothetical protein